MVAALAEAAEVVAAGAADLEEAEVVAAAAEVAGAAGVEVAAATAVVAVAAATGKQTLIGRRPICAERIALINRARRVAHRAAARCVSARAAAFPARASSIRSTRPPAYR